MIRIIKSLTIFLVLIILFLFFQKEIFAVSLTITSVDPAIVTSKDQVVSVNLAIDGLPSGESYFRAGWDSGSSYVGYVENNLGDWVKLSSLSSSECINYFKIDSSTTSAILKIKIGIDNEMANGNINIRAHRLTSTCGSNTSSNLFSTEINLPTPTPTPSPSPTISPTQNPQTQSPTKSPSPTPLKTITPTPLKTPQKTDSPTIEPQVLAENTEEVEPTDKPTEVKKSFPVFAFVIIALGFVLIGVSGYLAYKIKYNNGNGKAF